MRVSDRLRRTGVATATAVVTGGTVAACSTAAMQPAVSPKPAAAERAGLRAGDVIHKLGPAPTPDAGALLSALAAADPGQWVELTVTQSGQTHTVPVTLGTLPAT